MVAFIIILIVVGFIAGLVARLLVPGKDPLGFIGTTLLGIAGSFIGGFIWQLIQYHKIVTTSLRPVSIIGSIIGAILLLIILRVTGLEPGHRRKSG
ncbi:MAG: GlsB/YeaQ/YmgE family stress response membrane protein [Actinobacteria bacterium]|nr:GlsB/YeaQ/YmgE family stress response membrane protein [Actinomycetota bacterium]